jgi:hypothetical protein
VFWSTFTRSITRSDISCGVYFMTVVQPMEATKYRSIMGFPDAKFIRVLYAALRSLENVTRGAETTNLSKWELDCFYLGHPNCALAHAISCSLKFGLSTT